MYEGKDPRRNAAGYVDMTAYRAIAAADSKDRLSAFLKEVFKLSERYGFHIEDRLVLRDKTTGKIWR